MADVIILDGGAVINMLKPIGVKTLQDYTTHVLLPFIKAKLRKVTRINIIWDVYLEDSLESIAREIRGKGIRRRVAPSNTIPGNCQELLRLADNKTFLKRKTCGQNMLCSRVRQYISSLAPYTHEEADTRMLLHAVDSLNNGYRRIILRTVDTDVVVLAVSTVVSPEDTEIWVAFVTGKLLRYFLRMTSLKKLDMKRHSPFPCSTPLRVVTLCRRLLAGEKRLHLTYGSLSLRSHLHFLPC